MNKGSETTLTKKSYLNTHQSKFAIENPELNNVRRPEWLKVRIPNGENYLHLKKLVDENKLNTVCEDARCPNIAECWGKRTATFLILGNICTRSCGFCSVKTGKPGLLDKNEPQRITESVKKLNLKYAVITSVNRDDLKDGGAEIFADVINKIKELDNDCKVEVLIPDFRGDWNAHRIVLEAKPDVLAHNIETVKRLYHFVRPQAVYERSLEMINRVKNYGSTSKSGFMVGLGETTEEIKNLIEDLKKYECDILTIGQYLKPTKEHLPVQKYYHPEEFIMLKEYAYNAGFRYVESGALVRSSYHAEEHLNKAETISII